MEKKKKNLFYTFLKVAVTLILLYAVFSNIPFKDVWKVLKQANPTLLFIALVSFLLSQWLSANRLLILFRWSDFALSQKSNYMLYLIGMFYNFFIPGGIGGDAYKVYILNKTFKWPIKKLSAVVFVDRFMGLIAIGILIVLLCFFVPFFTEQHLLWLLILALILGIIIAYIFIKKVFPSFLGISFHAILKSVGIQLLQCICVIFLLSSISQTDDYIIYVIAFLVSSVLSIFSFSGIGVREMIFYQASTLLAFDTMKAVTIGLLFSVLTAFVSFFGIYFHLKKKNKRYLRKKSATFY